MSETPKQRNARACETCRASKTRCIYKSDVGDCQRCEATGGQCIVRTKARPGRIRAARPSNGTAKTPKPGIFNEATGFSLDLPAILPPDTGKDLVDLHNHHKDFFGDDDPLQKLGEHDPRPVDKRQVTLTQAEELLAVFRQKSTTFPFVQIPADATVPSLARESPFLLLSMLTSASIRNLPLYHQLDHEFRRVLSMKVIVEGQKSLDFLQGLLVYIAWYPIHISPKNNQSFMYMSLAISLVSDLGLDREPTSHMAFSSIKTERLFNGDGFSTAAKRAYLGCYYMSSTWPISLSLGYQKANNMQYRNLMDEHGESLLRDEHAMDIYSIVKLQRLSEKVSELYNAEGSDAGVDPFNDEVNIQVFLDEIQTWKKTASEACRSLRRCLLNLYCYYTDRFQAAVAIAERSAAVHIYSQQLGFLKRPYRMHQALAPEREIGNPAHLWSCLEACKNVLEYILSLPETTYETFTVTQWATLVHAVLALSRLTFLMASRLGWSADIARSTIPLVMYLDCLSYRFGHLTTTPCEGLEPPKAPDAPYVFKTMLESVKKSYERRVAGIKPGFLVAHHGNTTGISKGHCPIADPDLKLLFENAAFDYQADSLSMSGTPASNSSSSTIPLYHDLWATMTGSWVEI